jgi:Polysaccharide pyruvyl transferase
MKIGVLTYTREYANLGTVMQSYCTLRAIQREYPDARVELVDYAASQPARRPYLSSVSMQSLIQDFRRLKKYDQFFRKHMTFSEESLTTENNSRALEFIERQSYDAIYVGADTVLELKHTKPDSITPYWLSNNVGGVNSLVAASSLNVTYDDLSSRQKHLIRLSVDAFAMLGVRDHATYRLLSRFTEQGDPRLEMVPDPTFTYAVDYNYIHKYMAERQLRFTAPVVCLHLLRDSSWAADLASYFRRAGYVVASLRPAKYADITLTDLSPFEQIGIYKYFSLVVTHRFHDTIFCLKNMTPVICFPERVSDVTPHGESKILSLLTEFGVARTSYIPNKESITAEAIIDRYPSAISHFVEARSSIGSVLREQADKYNKFIRRSRLRVEEKRGSRNAGTNYLTVTGCLS